MPYLDTSALVKLYYPEDDSAWVAKVVGNQALAFTGLHELELTNALMLKVYRREATGEDGRRCLALVVGDLATGTLVRPNIDTARVWQQAAELAQKHTQALGCRSLDLFHVAQALALGSDGFVTFDDRQRKLARKVKLRVP